MSRLSQIMKASYLLLVILFSAGVFFYLLDSWKITNLEKYLPSLEESSPLVAEDYDAPTELEWDRLRKEQARNEELELQLNEEMLRLQKQGQELKEREETLEKEIESLEQAKRELEEQRKSNLQRQKLVGAAARRLRAMPPQEAVAIVANWSNSDLVDVLREMERNSEAEGRQSIVPYLLTLIPKERASLIMSLMLDEKAELLPEN